MSKKSRGIPVSFDQYLATGTAGKAIVSIQMDPEAIGEATRVADRIEELLKRQKRKKLVDDDAVSAAPSALDRELAKLEAEGEVLHERILAGIAEWTLVAPNQETIDEIVGRFPTPEPPRPPILPDELPSDASQSAKKRFERRMRAAKPLLDKFDRELREWRNAIRELELQRNCAIIAAATVSITMPAGEFAPPSAEGVLALYRGTHGNGRYEQLLKAVNDALNDTVEVDRPTLPGS